MIKRALVLSSLAIVLAFALVTVFTSDVSVQAIHLTQASGGFAIDMDPTGNVNGAESGANCSGAIDNDGDGAINDGCQPRTGGTVSETGAQCNNATDDDQDTKVNDGCPEFPATAGAGAEDPQDCGNGTDDDGDGVADDGCAERGAACDNAVDNDGDTRVNDGCNEVAAERGSGCGADTTDNDGDGFVNDGCTAVAVVDTTPEECAVVQKNGILDADEDVDPDSVQVDITIKDIPATHPMLGFAYALYYDPTFLSVSAAESTQHFLAAIGTSSVLPADDSVPDTDGKFNGTAADTAGLDVTEWGSGTLARLVIAVADGAPAAGYELQLYDTVHIDHNNTPRHTGRVDGAWIAVDVTCASLGAAPPPDPTVIGDVDCNGLVNSIDALKILRYSAGLSVVQTEPCTEVGTTTTANVTATQDTHIGDVDCSGAINSIDALKVLRKAASLSVTQTEPCDDVGT